MKIRHVNLTAFVCLFSVCAMGVPGFAQQKASESAPRTATQPTGSPTARTHPNDPMLWDAEQMMEEAVQQISKRYHLTEQQEQYTRLYLKQRVREFLNEYESDVRELLQESIDMRLGKSKNDPAALMKWAIRAMPVYDAAKNAILDGNREWGEILDAEQKKIHENDLRLMTANFEGVTNTLRQWEEGKGRPIGAPNLTGPNAGEVSRPVGPVRRAEIEDSWIAYVERFITTYKLNEDQKISAREKIHKDQVEKAKQFREANRDKFRRLDEEKEKIGRDLSVEERMKRIRDIDRRKKDLEDPVRRLFLEMARRLDALPSSAQRAEASEQDKKSLEDLHRRLAGEPASDKPAAVDPGDAKPKAETPVTSAPADTPAQPTTSPSAG